MMNELINLVHPPLIFSPPGDRRCPLPPPAKRGRLHLHRVNRSQHLKTQNQVYHGIAALRCVKIFKYTTGISMIFNIIFIVCSPKVVHRFANMFHKQDEGLPLFQKGLVCPSIGMYRIS
jgi:hypothetical protein